MLSRGLEWDAPAWQEPRESRPVIRNGFRYDSVRDAEAACTPVDAVAEWERLKALEPVEPPRAWLYADPLQEVW